MGSTSHGLRNPLIESKTSSAPPQHSSRFDFYTDNMSAFSTKTKRNNSSPQVPQGHTYPRLTYPDTNRPPTYPDSAIRSPQERMIQSPAVRYNQSPLPSPTETSNAMENPPSAWGGSKTAVNYNYPPKFSQAGRGGGRWRGNRVSPGSVSVQMRPHLYYKKEMVEDPWKVLRAVIWKGFDKLGPDKSRPSKFVQLKKVKVSSEHSHRSTISQSQPSLAEYLASTVNESAIEVAAHEPGT